ncbi:MAG: YbhB/YbcL family Raf kinase inhibitor-like protein [Isosphaerales bacterium]
MSFAKDVARAAGPAVGITSLLMLLASTGCGRTESLPADDPGRLTIQLRSPAFAEGGMIPKTFTCDGSDRSPPLEWSGVPASARALALICDDPDAPGGTWSHWVVFNLPSQLKALREGVPKEETIPEASTTVSESVVEELSKARQGKNDFGKNGYGGPCPPSGTHRYFFRLYALDATLDLGSNATRAEVIKAIEGRILAEGRLAGKYRRGGKE